MPTKSGRITSYGRAGPKFTEAFLDPGDRVELSPAALAAVRLHDPSDWLVFVERRGRLFHYVQWVGTPLEAVEAVKDGILRPDEIPQDIRTFGEAIARSHVQIADLQRRRYEDAILRIHELLPSGSPTPVLSFAKLMTALVRLDEAELDEVRLAFESRDGRAWMTAFSALSDDALRVGYWVRWVRWPNPTDEAANAEFRMTMDSAASATESAAAALAEPALSVEQASILYAPLAGVIPRERVDV